MQYSKCLPTTLLIVLAVGCGGDELIGPPDSVACTRGDATIGAPMPGEIGLRSCLLFNDYLGVTSPAESWTLRTEPQTAYIVRMIPVANAQGVNALSGALHLYARTDDGDPYYATRAWGPYGAANANGGRASELVFTSRRAETVSLRVQAQQLADTGTYRLEITTCPLVEVTRGAEAAAAEFSEPCALLSTPTPTAVRAAFFSFDAAPVSSVGVKVTRTGGDADLQMLVRGPDLDFRCVASGCSATASPSGAGPFTVPTQILRDGWFSAMVLQKTAGTLQASVAVLP